MITPTNLTDEILNKNEFERFKYNEMIRDRLIFVYAVIVILTIFGAIIFIK